MSNNLNFSWSFSLSPTAPAGPEDRWAFDDCWERPLPQGMVLLINRRNGRRTVVSQQVLLSLRYCKPFRTLDDHGRYLARILPHLRGQEIENKRVLGLLRQAGMLTSGQELLDRLWDPSPPGARPKAGVACITTCDRPGPLQRLLGALPASEDGDYGLRYLVVDDSRLPEHRERNRELVAQRALDRGVAIHYLGILEQQGFLEQLRARLPQCAAEIDFLLAPPTDSRVVSHGRPRNLALVFSAGQQLLFLDDDILPRAFRPPLPAAGLGISSRRRQAAFFSGPQDWANLADPEGPDALRRHAALLGLGLGAALARVTTRKPGLGALDDLTASEILRLHVGSPILLTACGSYGDPGVANNRWLFDLDGDSLQRLVADESQYRQQLAGPNLWLGRADYQFLPSFALLSQLTGMDNRVLLPPFLPRFRNEDLLFGQMAQILYPDAVMADLPWAIAHLPDPPRRWKMEAFDTPGSSGILGFTADALGAQRPAWACPSADARLLTLAAQLRDMATMPAAELGDWVLDHVLQTRVARINHWQRLLDEETGAPAFWRQDLLRILKVNQESLTGATTGPLLKDLPEGLGADQVPAYIADLWRRFADALVAWPQIRAAAQEILAAEP